MSLPIAILAGGIATRLRPVTDTVPKALVDVAGKPFAVHQIELLGRHGVREVVWLVGYRADQIESALGDGSRWGMQFRYVHDGPTPLGTGGAVRRALPWLGAAFFVMYGDSYLECDYRDVERAFRSQGPAGLMTVYRNEGRYDTSNVELVEGRIRQYEKGARAPAMRHIDWGLGVFAARAFERYADGEPLDLAQVYQDLLAAGDLCAYEVSSRFYEIGSPKGLAETEAYLRGATQGPEPRA